jgi:hypothetical protein
MLQALLQQSTHKAAAIVRHDSEIEPDVSGSDPTKQSA